MADRPQSMRPCPTCGTPAYCQHGRCCSSVTPNEAILRGLTVLERGLPGLLRGDIQNTYELIEEIFRAVSGGDCEP